MMNNRKFFIFLSEIWSYDEARNVVSFFSLYMFLAQEGVGAAHLYGLSELSAVPKGFVFELFMSSKRCRL